MKKAKQVIVIRKDLNMRKGKMCAQASHASMKVLLDRMSKFEIKEDTEKKCYLLEAETDSAVVNWIDGLFTKICVSVESELELREIYQLAKENNIHCALITDAGLTEFNGVPTVTCCAIGPAWEDEIDSITQHLKLL